MCCEICEVGLMQETRNGPLTRCVKLGVVHAPGMPGTFSPACITARALRTCRDACGIH